MGGKYIPTILEWDVRVSILVLFMGFGWCDRVQVIEARGQGFEVSSIRQESRSLPQSRAGTRDSGRDDRFLVVGGLGAKTQRSKKKQVPHFVRDDTFLLVASVIAKTRRAEKSFA